MNRWENGVTIQATRTIGTSVLARPAVDVRAVPPCCVAAESYGSPNASTAFRATIATYCSPLTW